MDRLQALGGSDRQVVRLPLEADGGLVCHRQFDRSGKLAALELRLISRGRLPAKCLGQCHKPWQIGAEVDLAAALDGTAFRYCYGERGVASLGDVEQLRVRRQRKLA